MKENVCIKNSYTIKFVKYKKKNIKSYALSRMIYLFICLTIRLYGVRYINYYCFTFVISKRY